MKTLLPHPNTQLVSYLLIILTGIFVSLSCSDRLSLVEPDTEYHQIMREDPNGVAKHRFGQLLLRAMIDEEPVREFLKEEAMKMFNYDYDVFYPLVKDKPMANGKTLRETLLKYSDNPGELYEIETSLPLLTIFVPELPENSFSAQSWNTATEIPHVAVRLTSTNDVPMFTPEGDTFTLEADLIPGYPVVVIKNNERIVHQGQKVFETLESSRLLATSEGIEYKFIDDVFDKNLENEHINSYMRVAQNSQVHQKLHEAYSIYSSTDGWQRDYIYYDLTPGNPKGTFKNHFIESLSYFQIIDGWAVYERIADQTGDPKIINNSKSTGWTDGQFEFVFFVLVQAKNGLGSTFQRRVFRRGDQVFKVTYESYRKWFLGAKHYRITSVTAIPQNIDAQLVNWDIEVYATSFLIDLEEADNTEIIKTETTERVKFAMNFEFNPTLGLTEKLGLKFGTNFAQERESKVSRESTLGGDRIGQFVINFQDAVITSKNNSAQTSQIRDYRDGSVLINIEPRRVN